MKPISNYAFQGGLCIVLTVQAIFSSHVQASCQKDLTRESRPLHWGDYRGKAFRLYSDGHKFEASLHLRFYEPKFGGSSELADLIVEEIVQDLALSSPNEGRSQNSGVHTQYVGGASRPFAVPLGAGIGGISKKGSLGKKEVAAFEIDKLLGLHVVPPTVGRNLGEYDFHTGKWSTSTTPDFGSLQYMVQLHWEGPTTVDKHFAEKAERHADGTLMNADSIGFREVRFLDFIIGNMDRANNVHGFVKIANRWVAYDNERSFSLWDGQHHQPLIDYFNLYLKGDDDELNKFGHGLLTLTEFIPRVDVIARLFKIHKVDVQRSIGHLLIEDAIESCWQRILVYRRFLIEMTEKYPKSLTDEQRTAIPTDHR